MERQKMTNPHGATYDVKSFVVHFPLSVPTLPDKAQRRRIERLNCWAVNELLQQFHIHEDSPQRECDQLTEVAGQWAIRNPELSNGESMRRRHI